MIEEAGVEGQKVARQELVVDRTYEVGAGDKRLTLEPWDGFAVSYQLRYPPPIGEQLYEFELSSFAAYKEEIAPARTFGFMKDPQDDGRARPGLGRPARQLHPGGRGTTSSTPTCVSPTSSCATRSSTWWGDLYLLGFPIRGKVTARFTGHRDNIAILRAVLAENQPVAAGVS